MRAEAEELAAEHAPGLPGPVIAVLVTSWAQLIGLIGFEVFGQFNGVVGAARAEFFTHAVRRLARDAGLP
ncbi:WHG domain-containing protein [Streptomyces sp. NBC_01803]|uniref:WHG domain-containing protein n=1 Tax=Streptomyces sp. NBC_01803 TaxID=2975946 RepID=UPI002DDA4239|nr:WHG domain-containing protein [Streptomyces sp. NBC_01803]WSA46308.1 WHG domain-containing protein [Streptomyces sp. NBC_01803]